MRVPRVQGAQAPPGYRRVGGTPGLQQNRGRPGAQHSTTRGAAGGTRLSNPRPPPRAPRPAPCPPPLTHPPLLLPRHRLEIGRRWFHRLAPCPWRFGALWKRCPCDCHVPARLLAGARPRSWSLRWCRLSNDTRRRAGAQQGGSRPWRPAVLIGSGC